MSCKILYCDGDSWTAGDIVDPNLDISHINHSDNDEYRLPKVWPHKLGENINIASSALNLPEVKVVNKSIAGSSNDGIVRRVLANTTKLLEEVKPEELHIIIGWSSPERKDFFYSDNIRKNWETLYPAELYQEQPNKDIEKFYKIYVKRFWNYEEFTHRHIESVLLLHHFLNGLGIKHNFFNAFYESSTYGKATDLYETYYKNKKRGIPDKFHMEYYEEMQTNGEIDEYVLDEYNRIYELHYAKISFKTFCDRIEPIRKKRFDQNHPVERMHEEWSKYLYKQIFTPKGYLYNTEPGDPRDD